MSYARLTVPMDLGPTAADRVKLAGCLAKRLNASLVGTAARRAMVPVSARRIDPRLVVVEENKALDDLLEAQTLFRREAPIDLDVTWRETIGEPVGFISRQARTADLIIISRQGANDGDTGFFAYSNGSLLLEAGRPVLLIPPNLSEVMLDRMVIGWKDTREARRAVFDALPLLKLATEVFVVSVDPEADYGGVQDVAHYLGQHGCKASSRVLSSEGTDVTRELLRFTAENDASVLVAGAYGHTRLREWVFGGVTANLLESTPVCCLLSH